jgi:hypothetical protein
MRRFALFLIVASMLLSSVSVPCLAQDFKPYTGSKLDETASREASAAAPGKQSDVYTTAVVSGYKPNRLNWLENRSDFSPVCCS